RFLRDFTKNMVTCRIFQVRNSIKKTTTLSELAIITAVVREKVSNSPDPLAVLGFLRLLKKGLACLSKQAYRFSHALRTPQDLFHLPSFRQLIHQFIQIPGLPG